MEIKLGDFFFIWDFVYVKDMVSGFFEIVKIDSLIGEDCNIVI